MPPDDDGNLTLPAITPQPASPTDIVIPPPVVPQETWAGPGPDLVRDPITPPPLMKPMFDYVLVRPDLAEAVSQGGIFIPESQRADRSTGTVLAVGEGRLCLTLHRGYDERGQCTGVWVEPLRVKEGDRVFYSGYAAIKVSNDTGGDGKPETLLMFKEDDIIAILPPPVSPQV